MATRIVLNTISYHGKGAIENIVPELTSRGYQKALVCTDPDLLRFGVVAKVTDLLDKATFAYEVYTDIKANPTIENVQSGVAAFQASGADCIVAIGGGSAMDTAKAVGIIINNPEFTDYHTLFYQHWNFKTIFSFHQCNIFSLKSSYYSTSYFTQKADFISYFHICSFFYSYKSKEFKEIHLQYLIKKSTLFIYIN